MASTGVQVAGEKVHPVYAAPVPDFQALPSSISVAQLVPPTPVEYYPREEDLPNVDLKGHTVEELALVANVSVETIKTAIKVRQQQMLLEKKTTKQSKWRKAIAKTTTDHATQSTSEPAEKLTTQSTTMTTRPSTTPQMSKKKVVKKVSKNGQKVSFYRGNFNFI